MTNDEIDKVIAEFCGWKLVDVPGYLFNGIQVQMWQDPTGKRGVAHPCYSNDLNAMHEAEKMLDNYRHDRMRNQLWLLIIKTTERNETSRRVHSAQASERAEAFLRTIGKWRDE